jgi:hypothetical protein
MSARSTDRVLAGSEDFSLVLGGPLYQLMRRFRLSDDALHLLRRRILVLSLFAWLPLLVLSIVDGKAVGEAVRVPFLLDVDAHVRFLVSLPLLIVAEWVVHQRTRTVVVQFVSQRLVPPDLRPAFDRVLQSAARMRNSMVAEIGLVALVYGIGIGIIWQHYMVLDVPTWYAAPSAGRPHPQLAGWWYLFVSLPVFQFILLRWYFRLLVWTRLLWQLSRLPLAYSPLHPDGVGGIGFLSGITRAFAPLLVAQGALLAGTLANTILYEGAVLTSFYVEIVTFAAFVVFVVVGPLMVFIGPLAQVKRNGLREYSQLARRYVDEFDAKWLRGVSPPQEPLVGSADIQSLADLGNSFETIRDMRLVPVTRSAVIQLVVVTLLPLLPLLLTLVSFEELLKRLVKVVV